MRSLRAEVKKIVIDAKISPDFDGASFGTAGPYETIRGRVFGELDPDDPPVPELGGVPRCIFGNFDGYVRALEIANSPNIGVCLCCGTWMEGGKGMGKRV